jgi:ABC-type transporter Mla subunit MlaD
MLLVVGILLGKGVSLSGTRQIVSVQLEHSGGLENGSPVVVNGVKRGLVTEVRNEHGGVVAIAEIDGISDLREDVSARVSILEITGGKKLEITPGTRGSYRVGTVIPGTVAADIVSLVDDLGSVSGDVQSLIKRLDTISASVTGLLADGMVMANVRTITSDGALLVTDLRSFVTDNKADLQRTLRNAGLLVDEIRSAVNNNEPKVASLLDDLNKTVGEANTIIKRVDATLGGVDSLVANVNGVVTDMRSNGSVANRLLYDTSLGARLDSALSELNRFVKSARKSGVNVNVGIGHR